MKKVEIGKKKKTCSCSTLAFVFFSSVSSVCFLLDTGVVCNCVRHSPSLARALSLALSAEARVKIEEKKMRKKYLQRNFLSEQNAVSSHVILVCMLHIVLPYPSSSAFPFSS